MNRRSSASTFSSNSEMRIVSETCGGHRIANNASCTVSVRALANEAAGFFLRTLTIKTTGTVYSIAIPVVQTVKEAKGGGGGGGGGDGGPVCLNCGAGGGGSL
jgi:hypothetical protein